MILRRLLTIDRPFVSPQFFNKLDILSKEFIIILKEDLPHDIPVGSNLFLTYDGRKVSLGLGAKALKHTKVVLISSHIPLLPNLYEILYDSILNGTRISVVSPTPWINSELDLASEWDDEDELEIDCISLITEFGNISVASQGERKRSRS